MANIALPFGASSTRRIPTSGELSNGFPCGPADIELFNWLMWWLTGQVSEVMAETSVGEDDTDLERLAIAIRSFKLNYVEAGGTANALTGALSITPANWAALTGIPILIKTGANPNTGAATLNLNSLGTKSILRMDGADLAPGDIPASSFVILIYDGTALRNLLAGGPNAQSSDSTTWDTAGTYSWTVPAGVTRILVEVWGAGGGGGGARNNSAIAAGAGGAGGGALRKWLAVEAGDIIPVVVGAGGTAGGILGTDGGAGGQSSVAGTFIAPGGNGGAGAVDGYAFGGATGGVPTTGDVNRNGNPGAGPIDIGGVSVVSGAGGGAYSFPGHGSGNQGTVGTPGTQPGTGGNGGSANAVGGRAGGAGHDGSVTITY